jgi:hypothetical protein
MATAVIRRRSNAQRGRGFRQKNQDDLLRNTKVSETVAASAFADAQVLEEDLIRSLVRRFDKDGNDILDEVEQQAMQEALREEGFENFDVVLDGSNHLVQPSAILGHVMQQEIQFTRTKKAYWDVLIFLLTFALYLAVLFLQADPGVAYSMEHPVGNVIFDAATSTISAEDGRVATELATNEQIMTWFKSKIIEPIFSDPFCGDGICESPEEFPTGFRNYGCAADCGTYTDLSEVTVALSMAEVTPEDYCKLGAKVLFNICTRPGASGASNPTPVCYFEQTRDTPYGQPLFNLNMGADDYDASSFCEYTTSAAASGFAHSSSGGMSTFTGRVSLFDAQWEIKLYEEQMVDGTILVQNMFASYFHHVGGAVMLAVNTSSANSTNTSSTNSTSSMDTVASWAECCSTECAATKYGLTAGQRAEDDDDDDNARAPPAKALRHRRLADDDDGGGGDPDPDPDPGDGKPK